MSVRIELSSFINLSSPYESGAISDKKDHLVDVLFCIFRILRSTNAQDESFQCAGAIFKEKGSIIVRESLFDRCLYTSGANNKGGNAVCFISSSLRSEGLSIVRCAETEIGDGPIRGAGKFESFFHNLNLSDNHGMEYKGNAVNEITCKSEVFDYCQVCDSSGGRVAFFDGDTLSVTCSVFLNIQSRECFFELSGNDFFTSCCFKDISCYNMAGTAKPVFQQCSSDDSSIPNSSLNLCSFNNEDNILSRLCNNLRRRTKRSMIINLKITSIFLISLL